MPYLDNTASEQNRQQAALVAERVKSSLDAGMNLDQAMQNARGDYTPDLQGADTGLINATALPPAIAAKVDKLTIGQTSTPIVTVNGIDIVKVVNKQQQNQVIVPKWQTSHILARIDSNQSSDIAEQKSMPFINNYNKVPILGPWRQLIQMTQVQLHNMAV